MEVCLHIFMVKDHGSNDVQSPHLGKDFRKLGAKISLWFWQKYISAFSHEIIIYFQNKLVFVFYACDLVNVCISLLIMKPC